MVATRLWLAGMCRSAETKDGRCLTATDPANGTALASLTRVDEWPARLSRKHSTRVSKDRSKSCPARAVRGWNGGQTCRGVIKPAEKKRVGKSRAKWLTACLSVSTSRREAKCSIRRLLSASMHPSAGSWPTWLARVCTPLRLCRRSKRRWTWSATPPLSASPVKNARRRNTSILPGLCHGDWTGRLISGGRGNC